MRFTGIRPNDYAAIRLPSGQIKIVEIVPNAAIGIGKFGSFPAALLLGRPYHTTYEILDRDDGSKKITWLRPVPAAELYAEVSSEKDTTPSEGQDDAEKTRRDDGGVEFDIVADDGSLLMRNNKLTIDDTSRQALSMEEIEELKKASALSGGSGKEIIEKIMHAHSALGEKTSFSLAKYTLRKSMKYMKRFTILPLDVNLLTNFMLEKEHARILEMRTEALGLVTSWANVRYGIPSYDDTPEQDQQIGGGRWLIVDDASGLLIAAMAEKMGILYPDQDNDMTNDHAPASEAEKDSNDADPETKDEDGEETVDQMDVDESTPALKKVSNSSSAGNLTRRDASSRNPTHNTLTAIHQNSQGNLSLLKYFGFVIEDPSPRHPLYSHLKTITWLQLLQPEADGLYREPPKLTEDELGQLKSGKRGAYWRKRRRWEKVRRAVNETRAGGFDGLVVASSMKPEGILKHLVPLVRGGGQIVVYSPTVEPLTRLMDLYSRERKGAYVRMLQQRRHSNGEEDTEIDDADFPLDPTLLLNTMLQTSRARHWQVLPGRTHPLMTGKGGAEGYIFSATRSIPVDIDVQARGKFTKKRKADGP